MVLEILSNVYNINLVAVLVTAVVNLVMCSVWYSRGVFGTRWLLLLGKTHRKEAAARNDAGLYTLFLLTSIVVSFVTAFFIELTHGTYADGALVGFGLWLVVAMIMLPINLFEGRPRGLYTMQIVYQLIAFIVIGVLIAAWPASVSYTINTLT